MSSVFDHLHLKRNTAGSSNELSFDVLDNARAGADAKRDARAKPLPGSYHGVKGAATLSGQGEVERRKRARRAHGMRLTAVAIVAVAAVAGVAGYFGFNYYQDVQDFSGRFDALVEGFVQADECLASVDVLMASPLASKADVRKQVADGAPAARAALGRTKASAEEDRIHIMAERDGMALDQVKIAADARLRMLDAADEALALLKVVEGESDEAAAVWNDVLDADQAARAATEAANLAGTPEDITAARTSTISARESMQDVSGRLQDLDRKSEKLDLSAQVDYLKERLEALDHAVATGDALLAGDSKLATTENDAYNAADKRAVSLAEDLPLSIEEVVRQAHDAEFEKLQSTYDAARNQAIEADSLIREYRG